MMDYPESSVWAPYHHTVLLREKSPKGRCEGTMLEERAVSRGMQTAGWLEKAREYRLLPRDPTQGHGSSSAFI